MIVAGIILIIIGAMPLVYGIQMNNDVETQMESLFNNGVTDPGTAFIAIGGVLLGVGFILLICGIVKKSSKSNNTYNMPPMGYQQNYVPQSPAQQTPMISCNRCGKYIPYNSKFCNFCGNQIGVSQQRCPNCGSVPPQGSVFCDKCGSKLN